MTDLVTDLRDLARDLRNEKQPERADLVQLAAHTIFTTNEKRSPGRPSKVSDRARVEIRALLEQGASYSQTARELTEMGIPSATGGAWHPSSVGYWARKLAAQS